MRLVVLIVWVLCLGFLVNLGFLFLKPELGNEIFNTRRILGSIAFVAYIFLASWLYKRWKESRSVSSEDSH